MSRFMTAEWADDCAAVINSWPPPSVKESKLQDFWDWIDMVRPAVTGRLILAVRDMPPDAGADGNAMVLDLEQGSVVSASIADRAEVEETATYLLAGSYRDWIDMLEGYDVGKTIMYRRFLLEKGETLKFFTPAFYWTELLTAIQTVPFNDNLQPA